MNLRVETRDVGGWAVVSVAGELDVYTCPVLRTELETLSRCGRAHIVLDLARLDFTDSSGLGVIVGALKRALAANGCVRVACAQEYLLKMLRITGLAKMLTLTETLEQATADNATEP
jgi:anti-sigma B factor antagonist